MKRLIAILCIVAIARRRNGYEPIFLKGTTDKNLLQYHVGETIVFT